MNISEARKITGFEKCDSDSYSSVCETCHCEIRKPNAENYIRTCFEYDEGYYACNKCVKKIAESIVGSDDF